MYKVHASKRFDLLGNSLAILFGLASADKAREIIAWVEATCDELRLSGDLDASLSLPPCLIPFIRPEEEDWRPRYQRFNQPGNYHNGGEWPFMTGFYIAALIAVGEYNLVELKLAALSDQVAKSRSRNLPNGFNEWLRAQNGQPAGEDWQTWSAAMYLYTAACVERKQVPFFAAWNKGAE